MMNTNIEINRTKAIEIIAERTELRAIAFGEVINTFKETLERRTPGSIAYIKKLTKLLTEDCKVLIQYQTEYISENDMSGYWKCEKIKTQLIIIMDALNREL